MILKVDVRTWSREWHKVPRQPIVSCRRHSVTSHANWLLMKINDTSFPFTAGPSLFLSSLHSLFSLHPNCINCIHSREKKIFSFPWVTFRSHLTDSAVSHGNNFRWICCCLHFLSGPLDSLSLSSPSIWCLRVLFGRKLIFLLCCKFEGFPVSTLNPLLDVF